MAQASATSAVGLMLAINSIANAQLLLSDPHSLDITGFRFGSLDGQDARATGAPVDPITGHLWAAGKAELLDEESEAFARPGLAEIDLLTHRVVSTIPRTLNFDFDYAASLAIHPQTRNLWIQWLHVMDEQPNISGAIELTQSGVIKSLV
jgi:hypothetical protein